MTQRLRLLLIDDNPDDRTLAMHHLRREFPECHAEEVTNPEEFRRAVDRGGFDCVITDYQVGWTDGMAVLCAVKQRWPACPVIMFTGTGSEEVAVEAMRAGLDDYVLKSAKHIIRLIVAVRAALARANHARRETHLGHRLQTMFDQCEIGAFRCQVDGRLVEVNPAFVRLFRIVSANAAQEIDIHTLYVRPSDHLHVINQLDETGIVRAVPTELVRQDGETFWGLLTMVLGTTEQGDPVIDGWVEAVHAPKTATG